MTHCMKILSNKLTVPVHEQQNIISWDSPTEWNRSLITLLVDACTDFFYFLSLYKLRFCSWTPLGSHRNRIGQQFHLLFHTIFTIIMMPYVMPTWGKTKADRSLFACLFYMKFSESMTNRMKILSKYYWFPPPMQCSTKYNPSGLLQPNEKYYYLNLSPRPSNALCDEGKQGLTGPVKSAAPHTNSYCNNSLVIIMIIIINITISVNSIIVTIITIIIIDTIIIITVVCHLMGI